MNEKRWKACASPEAMLNYLHERRHVTRFADGRRRFRLFACACCRRVWHLLDEAGRRAVETGESYADGRVGKKELEAAMAEVGAVYQGFIFAGRSLEPEGLAAGAAQWAVYTPHAHDMALLCARAAREAEERERGPGAAQEAARYQSALLRDLFGNPHRPVEFKRAWRAPGVRALARAIYDERAFERLPELAGALEEAGCADKEVLKHCRSEGPHARGCWVVDLLLRER